MSATLIGRLSGFYAALGTVRGRLVASLALYGAALGAASFLVNRLSRIDRPRTPEHLSADATVIMSLGAAIVCGLLAMLIARWLTGGDERRSARNPLIWLAAGFGFGVLSPAVTGAALPMSIMLLEWRTDVIAAGEVPMGVVSSLMFVPNSVFQQGVFGLFTGFMAGALWGIGAIPIDFSAYVRNRAIAAWAPWAIAIALGAIFYAASVLGSPEWLARFG